MANPTITAYLADTTIPKEKRSAVAQALNSGTIDESTAVKGITSKYGNKYAPKSTNTFAEALASAPSKLTGAALDTLKESAPQIIKSAADVGRGMTQEQADTLESESKARSANILAREKAAAEKAGKAGVLMPSTIEGEDFGSEGFLQKKEQLAEGARRAAEFAKPLAQRMGEQVGESLKAGAEGLGEMATAGADTAQMARGFGKVANAPVGIASAPISATMTPFSQEEQEVVGKAMQAPAEIGAMGVKELLRPENKQYTANIPGIGSGLALIEKMREAAGQTSGIDVESEEYKQGVEEPIKQAINFMLMKGAGANAKGIQKVGEGAVQTIKKVGETPKAVGEVVSRLQEKPTGKVTTDLINAGVGEQHANILENKPHLTGTAAQYVERGIKNLKDMANRESTFEAPAKEIRRSRDIAKTQLKEIGKNMGKFMEEDLQGKNVSVSPIASAIDDVKTKLNIDRYADIGTEEAFSASDILKDSDIAKGLQEISKKIKSTRSYKGDLTSTVSGLNADGRAVIGIKRTINDIIKSSKNKAEVRAVFAPIIDAAENIIKENSNRYSTASSEYASLKQAIDNIDKAGGVTLSGGKKGFSAQQILKRSLKEGSPIYRDAIEALQKLEDEFGIEAPKDILEKAVLADMAEKITRSAPTKSAEAILPRPTGKLGIAVDAYQKAKRALKPTKEIEAKAQTVLNILKAGEKGVKAIK